VTATAVVVRWRGGDEVDRCLRALLERGGRRLEGVVLVDSGSADGGAERLAAVFPDIEIVALEENLSFAHAANAGALRCATPTILLLNPDTEIESGAVDLLLDALDSRPSAAATVPILVGQDDHPQHRWQLRRFPTTIRLAAGLSGAAAFSFPPQDSAAVEQPAAAAWMIRREIWTELGGFDEGFRPAWWEDVDFCRRLADGLGGPGLDVETGFVVEPAARVRHIGGSSVDSLSDEAFLSAFYRNLLRYADRHHRSRAVTIRIGLRAALRLRGALAPARRGAYSTVAREI
jgi:GT2 family glycosyltransferase